MIRFVCPSGYADRCSWTPGEHGVIVQVWHSERPASVATILIDPEGMESLRRLCALSLGCPTYTQAEGWNLDFGSPAIVEGAP